jgi:hypothetical protein
MYRIGEPIRAKTRLIIMKRKPTLGLEQSTVEHAKAYADEQKAYADEQTRYFYLAYRR